ncbi:MAG: precorrin-3B C(17)-methyltransferase [Alphaproteobacteria bacterium]|nr:precorrin-3B C(17)-methyltransferase [Alphaproteobacteria bacterium]
MTLPPDTAILVLGPSAVATAQRVRSALPGASIHTLAGKGITADTIFADTTHHVARLFAAGTPIVGICAAGILIRAAAPLLAEKGREPPLVALAEDGSVAVPLLGGHRGANALARAIAAATGGIAAVTTASDLRLGFALDEPPPGWRIANPERAKSIAAALIAGEPVALQIEAGDAAWLMAGAARFDEAGAARIRVTDRRPAAAEKALVLHPPILALGVGCARDCPADELAALAEATLAEAGLAAGAVAAVCSLDLKADEAAVHRLAERLGVPARFFTPEELRRETPRLASPSEAVFRATGCWGVAEGAALAAVGASGTLVVAKRKAGAATCAVARAAQALDASGIGRPRGRLFIVGIGPGDPAWRTPEAAAAIAASSDLVGYGLYLDLLGSAASGKHRHETPLGAETERARQALDLAAAGAAVTLVSSGDAGIYGLASLVFELLDREDRPDWRRVALSVIPGISALQAAAARAGAPLGHDFCAISLSDLLTPWPVIERRLAAAAEGDFVVALYNPRSARRAAHLGAARDILLRHRPPQTPVVLARNLGREGESLTVTTLAALAPEAVDMLTLVLIGSSETRLLATRKPWLYTPRGYVARLRQAGEDAGPSP